MLTAYTDFTPGTKAHLVPSFTAPTTLLDKAFHHNAHQLIQSL